MIANWLVSMKTTRLFFFCGAEELNYQETNKRKAANMRIRMFLRSICDYSCRARRLSCSVFAVSTRCSQTAALMWDGPGIHSFTTPAHVICFVKCAGTSGILIILRLVLSPSDEAGGEKKKPKLNPFRSVPREVCLPRQPCTQISFSYRAKCSQETRLNTLNDPQSR